jgi:hypothetical protein
MVCTSVLKKMFLSCVKDLGYPFGIFKLFLRIKCYFLGMEGFGNSGIQVVIIRRANYVITILLNNKICLKCKCIIVFNDLFFIIHNKIIRF